MPPPSPAMFALVALGGAIGATLRYGATVVALRRFGPDFPVATLAVNVVGSFLLGLAAAFLVEPPTSDGARWRAALLMTGVLGGFTTFSTFSLDAVGLALKGRWAAAGGYVAGSVALSIAAAGLGLALGRSVRSAGA